jgi:hypothetical protein
VFSIKNTLTDIKFIHWFKLCFLLARNEWIEHTIFGGERGWFVLTQVLTPNCSISLNRVGYRSNLKLAHAGKYHLYLLNGSSQCIQSSSKLITKASYSTQNENALRFTGSVLNMCRLSTYLIR